MAHPTMPKKMPAPEPATPSWTRPWNNHPEDPAAATPRILAPPRPPVAKAPTAPAARAQPAAPAARLAQPAKSVKPAQPAPPAQPASAPTKDRRKHAGVAAWVRAHKVASATVGALLILSGIVTAALLIRQDVTTNPSTTAPDVKFLSGTDYAAINAAGFATLTLGSSGASATLALSGVSGAALASLGNVMKLQNTDATQAYTVTLDRSAALNAAITAFTVTIKNGASTLLTWDAAAAATSGSFTLPVSTTLDISISLVVTDGTAAGALGSFGMQFSLAPV